MDPSEVCITNISVMCIISISEMCLITFCEGRICILTHYFQIRNCRERNIYETKHKRIVKYYDELQRRTVCHQILVKPWGKRGNVSFCPLTDYTPSCRPGWFISYRTTYISITNWFLESQICHQKYTWNLIRDFHI